jgi:hypothetical protein
VEAGVQQTMRAFTTVLQSLRTDSKGSGRRIVDRILSEVDKNSSAWQAELVAAADDAKVSGVTALRDGLTTAGADTPADARDEMQTQIRSDAEIFWQHPLAEKLFGLQTKEALLLLNGLKTSRDLEQAANLYQSLMTLVNLISTLTHAPNCPSEFKTFALNVLWCFYPYNGVTGAWCDCKGAYRYAKEVPFADFMRRFGPAAGYR